MFINILLRYHPFIVTGTKLKVFGFSLRKSLHTFWCKTWTKVQLRWNYDRKKQKDVSFLCSHFFLFSSITFPYLVLITCFIPKNVTSFHEEEVRSFGFCWSLLWRGKFCLQCPKLAKKVLIQKLPNSSSLFLSFRTGAIFGDHFQRKYKSDILK